MKKTIYGILALLIVSCNENPKMEFSLNGKTGSIENGTIIYLDNADSQTDDLIDSTVVENNSFVFRTKLSKSPLHVVLRTKDYSHYRFLWLENKPMTFDATKTDFLNATVKGSYEENLGQNLRKEIENLSEEEQRKKK